MYDGIIEEVGFLRAGLYDLILGFNLNKDQCYAGDAYISSKLRISTRSLTNQLRILQNSGLIYRNTYLTRNGHKRYICTRENCNSHYKNHLNRSNASPQVKAKFRAFWASHGIEIDTQKDVKPNHSASGKSGEYFNLITDLKIERLKETTRRKKVSAGKLCKKKKKRKSLPRAVVSSPKIAQEEAKVIENQVIEKPVIEKSMIEKQIDDLVIEMQKKERANSKREPVIEELVTGKQKKEKIAQENTKVVADQSAKKPVIRIYECLEKLDLTGKQKRFLSKKYTQDVVYRAIKAAFHPSTKITTTLIQYLIWFCRDPDSVVIPKTPIEIVEENTPFLRAIQLTMQKYGKADEFVGEDLIDGNIVDVKSSSLDIYAPPNGRSAQPWDIFKYSDAKLISKVGEVIKIRTPTLFRELTRQGFYKSEVC